MALSLHLTYEDGTAIHLTTNESPVAYIPGSERGILPSGKCLFRLRLLPCSRAHQGKSFQLHITSKEVTHNVSCGPFQIKTKKKGMNKTPRSYDFPFVVGRPTSSIPVAIAAPAPLPLPVALPHTPRHIQLSMQVDRLSSLLTQMIEESQQYNPAQLECLRTLNARLHIYYCTLSKFRTTFINYQYL